jgi:hypothetical protein
MRRVRGVVFAPWYGLMIPRWPDNIRRSGARID